MVAFYDLGILVDDFGQLSEEAVWQSVGVGLRWLVLDQIPVRADVGFPMNLRHFEAAAAAHISIGYPF